MKFILLCIVLALNKCCGKKVPVSKINGLSVFDVV